MPELVQLVPAYDIINRLLANAASSTELGSGILATRKPTTPNPSVGTPLSQSAACKLLEKLFQLAMRWLLVTAMALMGLCCVILAEPTDLSTLMLGYGVFGCGQGIISVVSGTAWARYFGRAHLGKIRGMSLTVAVAASAIGPVIMGVSADYLGGFAHSLWFFAVLSVLCAASACWATPPRTASLQQNCITRPIAA